MKEPSRDVILLPCMRCGKMVATPAGRFRFALRRRQTFAVFCSRRCNLVMVAEEGERWKRARTYA